jgi:hypothetical protein
MLPLYAVFDTSMAAVVSVILPAAPPLPVPKVEPPFVVIAP